MAKSLMTLMMESAVTMALWSRHLLASPSQYA
jgi:hypothetical protein